MDKTTRLNCICLQKAHFRCTDAHRLKVKRWKKIFHANRNEKKARIPIITPDKIDFRTKKVKHVKEGHYITIKGSIQEEVIIIINIYAPNIVTPK